MYNKISLAVRISALLLASVPTYGKPAHRMLKDVADAFQEASLVPDKIPTFEPTAFLDLEYAPSSPGCEPVYVDAPGHEYTMNQTHVEPRFWLTPVTESFTNQTFVLIAVDPDAPSRANPFRAEVRHLLASVRFRGKKAKKGEPTLLVNATQPLTPYLGPAPAVNTGWHRYMFVVYEQPANFFDIVDHNITQEARIYFNVSTFAKQMGLGNPIAGTFFSVSGLNETTEA